MQRTIALLDMDETLVTGNDNGTSINEALLESLMERGVKDICLFTSMNYRTIEQEISSQQFAKGERVYTRPEMIAELERRGFKVHAVITPADVALQEPGKYFRETWLPEFKKVNVEELQNNGQYSNDLKARVDAVLTEHDNARTKKAESEGTQYEKEHKGHMYKMFRDYLKTHPGFFGNDSDNINILFADDKSEELENVRHAHLDLGLQENQFTTIRVHTKNKEQLETSDVTASKNDETKLAVKNRYGAAISKHFEQNPNITLRDIFKYGTDSEIIQALRSGTILNVLENLDDSQFLDFVNAYDAAISRPGVVAAMNSTFSYSGTSKAVAKIGDAIAERSSTILSDLAMSSFVQDVIDGRKLLAMCNDGSLPQDKKDGVDFKKIRKIIEKFDLTNESTDAHFQVMLIEIGANNVGIKASSAKLSEDLGNFATNDMLVNSANRTVFLTKVERWLKTCTVLLQKGDLLSATAISTVLMQPNITRLLDLNNANVQESYTKYEKEKIKTLSSSILDLTTKIGTLNKNATDRGTGQIPDEIKIPDVMSMSARFGSSNALESADENKSNLKFIENLKNLIGTEKNDLKDATILHIDNMINLYVTPDLKHSLTSLRTKLQETGPMSAANIEETNKLIESTHDQLKAEIIEDAKKIERYTTGFLKNIEASPKLTDSKNASSSFVSQAISGSPSSDKNTYEASHKLIKFNRYSPPSDTTTSVAAITTTLLIEKFGIKEPAASATNLSDPKEKEKDAHHADTVTDNTRRRRELEERKAAIVSSLAELSTHATSSNGKDTTSLEIKAKTAELGQVEAEIKKIDMKEAKMNDPDKVQPQSTEPAKVNADKIAEEKAAPPKAQQKPVKKDRINDALNKTGDLYPKDKERVSIGPPADERLQHSVAAAASNTSDMLSALQAAAERKTTASIAIENLERLQSHTGHGRKKMLGSLIEIIAIAENRMSDHQESNPQKASAYKHFIQTLSKNISELGSALKSNPNNDILKKTEESAFYTEALKLSKALSDSHPHNKPLTKQIQTYESVFSNSQYDIRAKNQKSMEPVIRGNKRTSQQNTVLTRRSHTNTEKQAMKILNDPYRLLSSKSKAAMSEGTDNKSDHTRTKPRR